MTLTQNELKFIDDILAWPFVFFVLVLVFRFKINDLISHTEKLALKHGKTELTVESNKAKIEKQTTETLKPNGSAEASTAVRQLINEQKRAQKKVNKKQRENEQLKETIKQKDQVIQQAVEFLNFEKVYSLIFGTQIRLLQELENSSSLLSSDMVQSIFRLHKTLAGKAPTYQTVDDFLQFLVRFKLITIHNEQVEITETGKNFLTYIHQQGYSTIKAL